MQANPAMADKNTETGCHNHHYAFRVILNDSGYLGVFHLAKATVQMGHIVRGIRSLGEKAVERFLSPHVPSPVTVMVVVVAALHDNRR